MGDDASDEDELHFNSNAFSVVSSWLPESSPTEEATPKSIPLSSVHRGREGIGSKRIVQLDAKTLQLHSRLLSHKRKKDIEEEISDASAGEDEEEGGRTSSFNSKRRVPQSELLLAQVREKQEARKQKNKRRKKKKQKQT
jgi:hypothetical protein